MHTRHGSQRPLQGRLLDRVSLLKAPALFERVRGLVLMHDLLEGLSEFFAAEAGAACESLTVELGAH